MNENPEILTSWSKEIDQSVRESRTLCAALFSRSGEVLFSNPAMAQLLGTPPAASFTNPTFESIVAIKSPWAGDPVSSQAVDAAVFSGFVTLTKGAEDTSILARVYRRDDRVLVVGEPDVTSLAKQYQSLVEVNRENNRLQRDLTKQKHALQQEVEQRIQSEARVEKLLGEKEVILREVHHRIKNNMTTVMSVLRLQSRLDENGVAGAILLDAAERISTMMLLYNQLYQSPDVDAMELDQYLVPLVKQVIETFPHGGSIRVNTAIAPIKVKTKVLSELGMLIYELITNAMKYAFVDREAGVLTIEARCEGSTVTIFIADDGPGLPEQSSGPTREGFGTTLVNALVQQLDGTFRNENDGGAQFTLTFEL